MNSVNSTLKYGLGIILIMFMAMSSIVYFLSLKVDNFISLSNSNVEKVNITLSNFKRIINETDKTFKKVNNYNNQTKLTFNKINSTFDSFGNNLEILETLLNVNKNLVALYNKPNERTLKITINFFLFKKI